MISCRFQVEITKTWSNLSRTTTGLCVTEPVFTDDLIAHSVFNFSWETHTVARPLCVLIFGDRLRQVWRQWSWNPGLTVTWITLKNHHESLASACTCISSSDCLQVLISQTSKHRVCLRCIKTSQPRRWHDVRTVKSSAEINHIVGHQQPSFRKKSLLKSWKLPDTIVLPQSWLELNPVRGWTYYCIVASVERCWSSYIPGVCSLVHAADTYSSMKHIQ